MNFFIALNYFALFNHYFKKQEACFPLGATV